MENITIRDINKVDKNNGSISLIYNDKDVKRAVHVNVSDGVYIFKQFDIAYDKRVKLIKHIEDNWGYYL